MNQRWVQPWNRRVSSDTAGKIFSKNLQNRLKTTGKPAVSILPDQSEDAQSAVARGMIFCYNILSYYEHPQEACVFWGNYKYRVWKLWIISF